ncbi:MAG TPA: 6-bladed beta-propeller [Clostridiales bacterium]|nr:6-bladed beta-propeller [Clostridiales bacterium]
MKITTLLLTAVIITLISCSSEKPYTESIQNGVKVIENEKTGISPDFKFSLKELYTIQNSETDTSFVLNFPGDRSNLNSDLDSKGNLFVVDNKRSLILKFDNKGKFISSFGGKGQGPGEFPRNPVDISVMEDQNKIYVFDGSGRLTEFDMEGKFIIFHNISSRSVRAMNFYMTVSGPLFGCEAYEGQWGTSEFKMGQCLYNGSEGFDIKNKLYGNMKEFDIKKIDADDQGIISAIKGNDIFIADVSKSEYIIHKVGYSGEKILDIRKKYAPVRRSKEDMEGIQDALDKFTRSTGGMIEFKPVSNLKSVVTQMFVDGKDNLWAGVNESLFNDEGQEFDIFDKDGRFLKRVFVPELTGLKIRSKGKYIIASTPIEQNYSEDGKADIIIKVFELNL